MSTRSGVIIKKNKEFPQHLYHHFDGYPEGVGADLDEYLEDMFTKAVNGMNLSVQQIASDLCMGYCGYGDDTYERVETLTWDMEYVYVIDLDELTITCYSTCGHPGDDLHDQLIEPNIITSYKPESNNIKKNKNMETAKTALVEQLRTELQKGVVKFTYRKKNGDLREAEGTTNFDNIPEDKQPTVGNAEYNPNVQRYYDTKSDGWRSFVIENLVSVG